MNVKIERTIVVGDLQIPLPKVNNISIKEIYIGSSQQSYTYTQDVHVSNGQGSGGGTRTKYYSVYHFGFSVINQSSIHQRIQFAFSIIDRDGYTVGNNHCWRDIAPGHNGRIWSDFWLRKPNEYYLYMITEIGIGPTPPEGVGQGKTTFVDYTKPNKSVGQLFELNKNPIKIKKNNLQKNNLQKNFLIFMALIFALISILSYIWF